MEEPVRLSITLSGGGGFFLACEDFEKMFDNLFPACAFLFILFIYLFFKWRLAPTH